MSDLKQLLKQQEELAIKIEKARIENREAAIAQIKIIVEEADLKIEDIYSIFPKKAQAPVKTNTRASPKVKYKDNKGHTWSGRGALPIWVRESGKPKEFFLIKD